MTLGRIDCAAWAKSLVGVCEGCADGVAIDWDGAVDAALGQGLRTPDLAGGEGTREVGTEEMTKAVIAGL